MNRILLFGAALGLALGTTQAADILANGNMDDIGINSQNGNTPNGWVVEASKTNFGSFSDGASSEPWCNIADPGGYGLFLKPFQGDVGSGDLLSVYIYQDNPATPGTQFTFSGYAAAEANYSGLQQTNSPGPATLFYIEFLDAAGSILSSNSLNLVTAGLPIAGPSSMIPFTLPQYTAPANTTTVRAGVAMLNVYGTSGGQSFFVDAFSLDAVAPAGSPEITAQPAETSVVQGATATFTVGVANSSGVTYQWQHAKTNLTNGGNISGANSATLTVANASSTDVGHYRCLVSNASGAVYSADATLALFSIDIAPVIALTGKIGDTYRIEYATELAPTTWIPLSNYKLATSPQLVYDLNWRTSKARYYRAVFVR